MILRPLGTTGITVSPLGLGTVKLGRNRAVKYPGGEGYALPTDEQATALLRTAAELGINLIDTAPAYGIAEERLGELLSRAGWFGSRDRWVLCTKAGEEFNPRTGESRYAFSPLAIRASVERSLRRLRTDLLDVVLLHSDGRDEWVLRDSGALDTLRDLQRQGLARAIGISSKSVEGGTLAVQMGCGAVMATLNPTERADEPVIAAAARAGTGVLIKKGLGSGHLPAGESIRFVLSNRAVSALIIGTTNPEHLRANAAAAGRSPSAP